MHGAGVQLQEILDLVPEWSSFATEHKSVTPLAVP